MKLLGFSFKKISTEKLNEKQDLKDIKINTHMNIQDIIELDSSLFKLKDSVVNVSFSYVVEYAPNFAKLEFAGNLVLSLDSKLAKETLKGWKDKKLSEEFQLPVLNLIIRKVNVKALALEDEFNLPLHMPMPSLKKPESTGK